MNEFVRKYLKPMQYRFGNCLSFSDRYDATRALYRHKDEIRNIANNINIDTNNYQIDPATVVKSVCKVALLKRKNGEKYKGYIYAEAPSKDITFIGLNDNNELYYTPILYADIDWDNEKCLDYTFVEKNNKFYNELYIEE